MRYQLIAVILLLVPFLPLRADEGAVTPPKGGRGVSFLGRNSLVLYVFSPIFTVLCKRFVPYLQFDHTGLIFLMVSLIVCVAGSLAIAWMMDLTGISRFFFGRKAIRE